MFPFLNRLLLHGADSPRLSALRKEAPGFLHFLRQDLAARGAAPSEGHAVFQLQQLLEGLPASRDEVVAVAQRIAGTLSASPRPEEPGPTSIAAVNQVLQALSSCSGAEEELDFILALATQCRNSLRRLAPSSAVEPLNLALGSLERMERAIRETRDFEELLAAASELEASANALAESLEPVLATSLDEADSKEFDRRTKGLSPLFRSVLEPGFSFLSGRIGGDPVLAASDHLDQVASQIYREATRHPIKDRRLELLREALESMQDAAEALRSLESSRDPQTFEVATTLCFQASEQLNQAGIK